MSDVLHTWMGDWHHVGVITLGGKGVADFEYDQISLTSHIRPGIGTCGWNATAPPCHLEQEDHPSAPAPSPWQANA